MTTMPMVPLGRSGVRVSRLCLGTMMFGGRTEEADSAIITDRAIEAGVNFIDTADAYNGGRSEEILGRILKTRRDRLVIASKLANPMGPDPNHRGLSPTWMLHEVPRILKRLDTDRLDVLYLHKEDVIWATTYLAEEVGYGGVAGLSTTDSQSSDNSAVAEDNRAVAELFCSWFPVRRFEAV